MKREIQRPEENFFSVRVLSERHLGEVYRIEQEAFQRFWSLKSLEEIAAQKTVMLLGAYGEELAGYGIFQVIPPEAELLRIAVQRKDRHRGAARRILEAFLSRSHEIPVTKLMLEVDEKNSEALKLYLSLGFVTEGRREHYYEESDSDAILMSLFPELTGVSCGKTGLTTV